MPLFTRRRSEDDPEDPDDFDDLDPLPAPGRRAEPERPLRPMELREWEIPLGYAIAAILVVVAVLELTVTTGAGAPKTHNPILPAVAIVSALTMAATIRFKNRFVTALSGVVGGVLINFAQTPHSLSIPRSIGFLVPFAYAFVVVNRHNRAVRVQRGPRNAGQGGARRGSKVQPEPTGPKASRRYTPPKAKGTGTRRR